MDFTSIASQIWKNEICDAILVGKSGKLRFLYNTKAEYQMACCKMPEGHEKGVREHITNREFLLACCKVPEDLKREGARLQQLFQN